MPCTLQPWEVEFEEKRYHREEHGLDVTHLGFVTAVACWLAKHADLSNAPAYVKSWIKQHDKEDKER